jgi:uncharacterized protein
MQIDGKVNFSLKVQKSNIHGEGAFALEKIPAKKKVGSLGGIIISKKAARKKAAENHSISIVELWNGKALDASTDTTIRFINHSCSPNTYMRNFGNHVEFYALRDIKAGEELSCNYGPTHHDGKRACNCGAKGCKGFI